MPLTRKLKIQSRIVDSSGERQQVPVLTLSGKWLADAGFVPGEMVQVQVRNKFLYVYISPDAKPPEE